MVVSLRKHRVPDIGAGGAILRVSKKQLRVNSKSLILSHSKLFRMSCLISFKTGVISARSLVLTVGFRHKYQIKLVRVAWLVFIPAMNIPINSSIIRSGLVEKYSLLIKIDSISTDSPSQLSDLPAFLSLMIYIRCLRYVFMFCRKTSSPLLNAVSGASVDAGLLMPRSPKSVINWFVNMANGFYLVVPSTHAYDSSTSL